LERRERGHTFPEGLHHEVMYFVRGRVRGDAGREPAQDA
jgi:hypothetical protein